MTDEELAAIRAVTDGATPGPWFLAYASVCDRPRTQEFMRLEREIPEDAPESAYEELPDAAICHVPVVAGDTPTAQGEKDAKFIAAARTAVPRLLDEIESLRPALAEAIYIFNTTWCSEHGHAPRPDQIDRMNALEQLVADEVKKIDDDRRRRAP